MRERIHKFFDRLESRLALMAIAMSTMSGAGISAWVAGATQWLDTYGPIAWWFAGLLGGLVTLLGALAIAWLRYAWIKASAVRKWKQNVDSFNPLDPEFNKKRLSLLDLAHPVSHRISNKRFVDCELMGPANIFFHGAGTVIN